MMPKMKRGFFFSLMTFMLLFSILLFSADYISRSKQLQNSLADSRMSNKLVYVEDDVTYGALEDLAGVNVNEIARTPTEIIVNFTGGRINGTDHGAATLGYADFVSHNYSVLSNLEIGLENFTAGFYLEPFGSRYLLEDNKSSLTTVDYEKLAKLHLVLRINMNMHQLTMNSTPSDTGDREILLEVYDNEGTLLIGGAPAYLDPSLANDAFELVFAGGQRIEVRFGDYLGMPGSLVINRTGLSAEVSEMIATYNYTSAPVVASDGWISLYSPIGEMAIETAVVLKRG